MCALPSRTQTGETVTSSPVRATARVSATYSPAEPSVAEARRLVSATLAMWGADDLVDDAALLASELVTNAVVHAGTDIDISIALIGDAVEVAVTDRHPARSLPPAPEAVGPDREGGRGLLMTAALSTAWGIDYTNRTKRVWFRLPLAVGSVPAPRGGTEQLDPAALATTGVGTVRLDHAGQVVDVDHHAAALLGRDPAELVGLAWLSLCDPEDAAAIVSSTRVPRWQGSYRLLRGDGGRLRVQARHVRLPGAPGEHDTTVCVMVDHRLRVLLGDLGGPAATTGSAEGPFAASPELLVRLELDAVLERTVVWARDMLGGDGGYALLVTDDEDELEVRAGVGLHLATRRVPRQAGEGVTGRVSSDLLPVVHDDLADGPRPQEAWLRGAGVRSLVAAPVLAEGRLIGSVGVTSSRPAAFTVDHGAFLQRAVDSIALAVQSARVAEIERRRHGWLGYLAEASELLAGTLEQDMALALVSRLVAPQLGPWCAVHLADESGRPVLATLWHADEDRLDDLQRLFDAAPPPEPPAPRSVVRWFPAPDLAVPEGAADLSEAGGHVVALIARGRAIGSLTVGYRGPGDGQGSPRQQLHLLADLAPRAALALDNARLYAERTATIEALQRSLLPPELPRLPGVDVGVVYEATGRASNVGGDFYDVFRSPGRAAVDGERFAFAIGDVCGKGPEAAAVTGLARHALRLLSGRGDGIDAVLSHLNHAILEEGSRSRFMTVIYGEGRRTADGGLELRFAAAGHPAPVLVRADGSAEAVGASGDLLGVFADLETTVTSLRLAPGESLVCFTDGVTERRNGTRMLGEDGVVRALSGVVDVSATTLARRLESTVSEFAEEATRDDVAILVLRAVPADGGVRPPRPAE